MGLRERSPSLHVAREVRSASFDMGMDGTEYSVAQRNRNCPLPARSMRHCLESEAVVFHHDGVGVVGRMMMNTRMFHSNRSGQREIQEPVDRLSFDITDRYYTGRSNPD